MHSPVGAGPPRSHSRAAAGGVSLFDVRYIQGARAAACYRIRLCHTALTPRSHALQLQAANPCAELPAALRRRLLPPLVPPLVPSLLLATLLLRLLPAGPCLTLLCSLPLQGTELCVALLQHRMHVAPRPRVFALQLHAWWCDGEALEMRS